MSEFFWLAMVVIIVVAIVLNTPTRINPNYNKRIRIMIENEINNMIEREKKQRIQSGINSLNT